METKKIVFILTIILSFFIIGNVEALSYVKVAHTNGVYLRSAPSQKSKVLKKLKYNDVILLRSSIIEYNHGCKLGWYKVKFANKTGYVCSKNISKSNTTVKTKKKNTLIKNGPSSKYKTYKKTNKNTILILKSTTKIKGKGCRSGYYKINMDGKNKYVCSNNIYTLNKNSTVVVTNKNTILKDNLKNNKKSTKVSYIQGLALYSNKKYKSKNCKDGYYKVIYQNKQKYICSTYTQKTNIIGFTTTERQDIKSSTYYGNTLATLNYGALLPLVSDYKYKTNDCPNGYYKVKINKTIGYICSNNISLSSYITNVESYARVYKEPDTTSEVMLNKSKNADIILWNKYKIKGQGCDLGFQKVRIDNKVGYICSSYTKIGKQINQEEKQDATQIPILTFHRIVKDIDKQTKYKYDEWVASDKVFEEQVKFLYDNNYKTISLDEFYCWYQKKCRMTKNTVVITFDDGFYEDYEIAYPILKKYNQKATSFIVGKRTEDSSLTEENPKYINNQTLEKIKEEYPLINIQSHSYNFHYREGNKKRVQNMNISQIREDFNQNKNKGYTYIAYPFGKYTKDLLKVVKENNYKLGFRFFNNQLFASRKSPRYEIPRAKVNGYSDVNTIIRLLDY